MERTSVKDVWELELHLFKHAVDHGVRPITAVGIGSWPKEPDPTYFCYYQPRLFLFQNRPSRADFWQLVAQTPWMDGIEKEYKAIIDANEWPMVASHKVSSSIRLRDGQGREVGTIHVRRQSVYQNKSYHVCSIFNDEIVAVCGQQPNDATKAVDAAENKLMERLAALDHPIGSNDIRDAIRGYLAEIGIAPRTRKAKVKR